MSIDDNYLKNIKAAPNVEFIVPASQTAKELNNITVRKKDDAVERGLVSFSPNLMDYLGPEFIAYMSSNLDIDSKTTFLLTDRS